MELRLSIRLAISILVSLVVCNVIFAQITSDPVTVVVAATPVPPAAPSPLVPAATMLNLLVSNPVTGANTDPELRPQLAPADLTNAVGGAGLPINKNHVYIVHLLHWKVDANTSIVSSRWYTYKYVTQKGGAGTLARIGPDDIYRKEVAELISLQYAVTLPANTLPSLTYTVAISKRIPANITALGALFSAITGASGAKAQTAVVPIGPAAVPVLLAQSLAAQIDSTNTPAPFAWAFTMNALGAGAGAGGDCTHLTTTAKCSVTQTFTSLDAEYWNIGINISPHGPRENKYAQSSTGTITQTHTFHSPLYAVVDINLFARVWSMSKGPYFQTGLPLSGSAFHLPYVGIAQPIPVLQKLFPIPFSVYGGVGFMEQTFPRTLSIGQTVSTSAFTSDLTTDRAVKAVWGIEVPLGSIVSKIKGPTFK